MESRERKRLNTRWECDDDVVISVVQCYTIVACAFIIIIIANAMEWQKKFLKLFDPMKIQNFITAGVTTNYLLVWMSFYSSTIIWPKKSEIKEKDFEEEKNHLMHSMTMDEKAIPTTTTQNKLWWWQRRRRRRSFNNWVKKLK